MAQKLAVTVQLDSVTMQRLEKDAASNFDSLSGMACARLAGVYADGIPAPVELTDEAKLKKRKQELENERLEIEMAFIRKLAIDSRLCVNAFGDIISVIRSRVSNFPQLIPGLTPEQTAEAQRAVNDAFTDLSGDDPQFWQDLATGEVPKYEP